MGRRAQFLRRQLLALPDHLDAAPQRSRRLLQKFPLPGSADQTALAAAKVALRETDQGRDQLRHAVATARRDLKDRPALPHSANGRPAASRSILFRTIQTGAVPSCWIATCDTSASHSTRSASAARARARRTPSCSTGSSVSRMPGGVDHRHRIAVEIELHLDDVARGAGVRRHDRDLAARELIHQRRLADIRRPGDRDDETIAKPLTPPLPRQDFLDLGQQRFDLRQAPARSIPPARRPRPRNRSRPRSTPTLR